ncbi:hypothetical protein I314_03190, partial [Cryptococcus bacillisporus CA1873]
MDSHTSESHNCKGRRIVPIVWSSRRTFLPGL